MQSVLNQLTLAYRPLWSRQRHLSGIQLFVHNLTPDPVDGPQLLRTIHELWSARSSPLLVSPQSVPLLSHMLDHVEAEDPLLEVRGDWLTAQPDLCARVQTAHQRGARLVWSGLSTELPDTSLAACFVHSMQSLAPQDAIRAMQYASATATHTDRLQPVAASPVLPGQIYEDIGNRALMVHCLDQQGALALAGWPTEDVLHQSRAQLAQPSHAIITRLLQAIERDESIETIEDLISEDPLLTYRFLIYTNSAALGLRSGIDSLQRGLLMMGLTSLAKWLVELLPYASHDVNLRPVRAAMVIRARLSMALIAAGVENRLRREMYLCALLSQLDELLLEPLPTILRRLPLSERIYDAAVNHMGPYAPSLEMATALANNQKVLIDRLMFLNDMEREDVNRILLRTLSQMHLSPAD